MKAAALQSSSESAPVKKKKVDAQFRAASPFYFNPVQGFDNRVIQRKSPCACGGGCPRCHKQSLHSNSQTKPAISTTSAQDKQEADRVAEQVMLMPALRAAAAPAMSSAGSGAQRKCSCAGSTTGCSKCHEEQEQMLQHSGSTSAAPHHAPTIIGEVLGSPGQPLDASTRAFMEPRFGNNFSQIQVHTDKKAARSADLLRARAYTLGNHIVFSDGEYAPATRIGKTLLAHELTHSIQQDNPMPAETATAREPNSLAEAGETATMEKTSRPRPWPGKVSAVSAGQLQIARKAKLATVGKPKVTSSNPGAKMVGSIPNAYGTFTYSVLPKLAPPTKSTSPLAIPGGTAMGADITLHFKPHSSTNADATSITFIQAFRESIEGKVQYLADDEKYWELFDVGQGFAIDHRVGDKPPHDHPFYGYDDKAQKSDEFAEETPGVLGPNLTTRQYVGTPANQMDAMLQDEPSMPQWTRARSASFETAPYALAGADEGHFFGSFTWGYEIDDKGKITLQSPKASDDVSERFHNAIYLFIKTKRNLTHTKATPFFDVVVRFPAGSQGKLSAADVTHLDPVATYAKAYPGARLWVIGISDTQKTRDENDAKAIANAHTVRDHLNKKGVALNQIHSLAQHSARNLIEEYPKPQLAKLSTTEGKDVVAVVIVNV
jgi:hypothetical protein